MTSQELVQRYLGFFEARGHAQIPSAPLIPEGDPTVLFTTAGMHPLVPYLLGERHPRGRRLVSLQRCLRTPDIDEIGDAWHLHGDDSLRMKFSQVSNQLCQIFNTVNIMVRWRTD